MAGSRPFRERRASEISLLLAASVFAGSAVTAYLLMPPLLRRLRAEGWVVRDMYKPEQATMVTHAGLLALGIGVFALLVTFLLHPPALLFTPDFAVGATVAIVAAQLALFTICGYGILGALDDRWSLSHLVKAAVPLTLGLPAAVLTLSAGAAPVLLAFIPILVAYQELVLLAIVPVYILVVTNLVNMHSGFNGLQSGLSLLLFGTLFLRLFLVGRVEDNLALLVIAGGLLAFFPYNRQPAKAVEGNVGSFLFGAALGVGIVANGFFLAGIVMLVPHITDFFLFLIAKLTGRGFIKFGTLRPDNTIEAPYPFKLKFLLPYYLPLTERQTVRILYVVTALFCALSFFIPA